MDLTNDADAELELLSQAIEAAVAAGFRGPAPDLPWFNDNVPADGSSWD